MFTTKTLSTAFLATMALIFSFGISKAGPTAAKAQAKLSNQITRLVSNPGTVAELNGEAVIFFTVDQDKFVHVKGIFGTNQDLIDHIEQSLLDKRVDIRGLDQDEEFQIKVKFTDLR